MAVVECEGCASYAALVNSSARLNCSNARQTCVALNMNSAEYVFLASKLSLNTISVAIALFLHSVSRIVPS